MKTSSFPCLFLVVIYSSLLAAVDGSSSSGHFQARTLKLQPERPNNVYYSLRGSTFVLNCSIATAADNVQAINLAWRHNGKWLVSELEQIDSTTVQLKLSDTSRSNNGIYWCGPKFGNMLKGVNISLTVADPPSPPRDLRWSVVGALIGPNREYRVFWSASSYTGGLPVNYSIKLCVNDSYELNNTACNWSNNSDCRPANVLSTKKDFFCVLLNQDFISPCQKTCNYTISVVAKNVVGSATSWRYLPYIDNYSVAPFPPLNFNVETTYKEDELKVRWAERIPWKYIQTEYTILYHAKNEMENETKVLRNKTEFTLLRHLVPFMEYYIYIIVRFVSEEGKRTAPSDVLGPRIVKTPAGDPDTPSKVIKDSSVTFPSNSALRNVTVEWEIADNSSWHGTPGKYIVYCNHHVLSLGSLPNCKYHVDATSTRTVLQRLKSKDKYNVYIKMCNKEGKCSLKASEPYIIRELKGNVTSSKNGGELSSKQIALITVSVVVGCITALFAVYVIRKWLRGEIREVIPVQILRKRITLSAPVPVIYEYADPLVTNEYDTLNLNENQV